MLELIHRELFCMLHAVEGEHCLVQALNVIRCMLLSMLEAVEGGFYLRESL